MPFALVFVGLLMVITGIRGTQGQFGTLLLGDFTGQKNFTYWLAALFAVGAVGYIKPLEPISRAFLVLILVSIVVVNKNFAQAFQQALGTTASPTTAAAATTATTSGLTASSVVSSVASIGTAGANLATAFAAL